MQNIKRFMLAFTMALLVAGCQVTIPPANNQGVNNSGTNATTLTILDAKALKGSEKVSVHAYSYTRGSDFCSRTIALKFSSELPYTQTLVAMRNRALVTGANAVLGYNMNLTTTAFGSKNYVIVSVTGTAVETA